MTVRVGSAPRLHSTAVDVEPRLVAHFERVARRHGGRLAIGSDRGDLTYAELNAAANHLAHLSLDRRGSRGDRLALLLNSGPGLYAAMIGGLKAARIVVVLNPADPADRLRQIASDCEPALILTDSAHQAAAATIGGGAEIIVLGAECHQSPDNPEIDIAPDDIAFLVYTSGSTGRPKAVMKSHGNILFQGTVAGRAMAVTAKDRVLMLASLSGGLGTSTAWIALANGAGLMSFPIAEKGVTGLARWITDRRVTVYVSAASVLRTFLKSIDGAQQFAGVRVVNLAADAATWQDFQAFRDHFPNARMVNVLGASEAGHVALMTIARDHPVGEGLLPVGPPCEGRQLRILDEDGHECPPGVVGNVEIRGRYLASGYWRDPDLTAKCFSRAADGMGIFRGGDLGFLTADGMLVLAGRRDTAIKIRGDRVDLSEVEQGLADLPGVESAAAGTIAQPNGSLRLVAYIVPAAGGAASERRMRTVARGLMARHLIPSSFVFLDRLPRTSNGKIDRGRLRGMTPAAAKRQAEPAASETERLLVGIWEGAFDVDGIGRSDDFFDLGGDSLVAAGIAARVHAAVGVEIDLGTFADAPSLKDLAAEIDRKRAARGGEDEIALTSAPRDRPIVSSFHQQAMWRLSKLSRRRALRYHFAGLIRLSGRLYSDALHQALGHVIERHEALRTRFTVAGEVPFQIVDPPAAVALPFVDLSAAADPEAEARLLLVRQRDRPFDLLEAPPVRFCLVKIRPDRHLLLRASHHIISDAPSWNIFLRDLGAAYEAISAGKSPTLPPLPFQYPDYAVWQRQVWRRDGRKYREMVAWWKHQLLQAPPWRERMLLMPFLRARPVANPAPDEWYLDWGLDADTSRRLDDLTHSEAATYYTVRLATVVPLLAALTGTDTVVIGGIFTRRNRLEFEPVFGLFADVVPLIIGCDWDLSFRQLIDRVRRRIVDIHAHAELPYGALREAMADEKVEMPPHHFEIHLPTQAPPMKFAGLEFRSEEGDRKSHRGMHFRFDEVRELDNGCTVFFDARIYDPSRMRDLVGRLVRFIEAVSEQPDTSLRQAIELSGVSRDLPTRPSKSRPAADRPRQEWPPAP